MSFQTANTPPKPPKPPKHAGSPQTLVLIAPEAQEVFLAGSFNNWNPTATPLTNIGHGHWIKEVFLPIGRYEYQFVVDGRWMHDRAARELIENPFGGMNSVLEIHRPQYAPPADVTSGAGKINPRWAWHYRALRKLHSRILKDRAEQISEAAQPMESHSMHLADTATDELDHELAVGELAAEENLLYEVEQAIQRILDGTYGKCQVTGKSIPAARLRAVPWTAFSREVEEELERIHSPQPASIGE